MADIFGHRNLLGTIGAYSPAEALGQRALEHGRHQVRLGAHVDQPANGADRIVGMKGGEDEMPGEGGANSDLRSLRVADLADKHDVGVLAENVSQAVGEGQPALGVHRNLVDPRKLVLDRILDRDDFLAGIIQPAQRRIEGGGLAGAGGSGDEHESVRFGDQLVHRLPQALAHAQRLEIQTQRALI